MARLEISDLVVAFDATTSTRLPVRRDDVVRQLTDVGDRRGAAIARRLPTRSDGVLDDDRIDQLLVRVHTELQRLSEEFQQGRRVEQLLGPLVGSLPTVPGTRHTVVDVGCGLGYLVRWLALRSSLGPGVDLVLGPLTMVRTAVLLAGALAAAWTAPPVVQVAAFVTVAVIVLAEALLHRWAAAVTGDGPTTPTMRTAT